MVGTKSNVLVMEIGWTDVGIGGYIIVSCAHSNTSYIRHGESLFENVRTYLYLKSDVVHFVPFNDFYSVI